MIQKSDEFEKDEKKLIIKNKGIKTNENENRIQLYI